MHCTSSDKVDSAISPFPAQPQWNSQPQTVRDTSLSVCCGARQQTSKRTICHSIWRATLAPPWMMVKRQRARTQIFITVLYCHSLQQPTHHHKSTHVGTLWHHEAMSLSNHLVWLHPYEDSNPLKNWCHGQLSGRVILYQVISTHVCMDHRQSSSAALL